MHTATFEGVLFARGVEVVRDFLVVDFQLHGIEREERAAVHRNEHGDLRARREQQVLLQQEQVAIEVDDFSPERLDLGIERGALDGRLSRRLRGIACEHGHRHCDTRQERNQCASHARPRLLVDEVAEIHKESPLLALVERLVPGADRAISVDEDDQWQVVRAIVLADVLA